MSKELLIKYFKLILFIIITGLMLWISSPNNIVVHILAMIILCISAIWIADFDLIHPYFWYSITFTLYSVSYPILYAAGIKTEFGYSKEVIVLEWIALTVFLLIVSPKKNVRGKNESLYKSNTLNEHVINIIWCLLVVAALVIKKGGYGNKKEIYSSNNIFLNIAFYLAIIFTIMYMYELINNIVKFKKVNIKLIVKVGSAILFMTMFSGERDLLFRFLAVTVLVLYVFKKINNLHLIMMIPFVMCMLPLSHIYKYYFLTGTITSTKIFNFNTLLFDFLNGEFISASKNLQVLINNEFYTNALFQGKTILNDFIRIFMKTNFTHGKWYNDTFFPHVKTTGYGFTIVGEGYVNFGYLGVILVFIILALFIRVLYRNYYKNMYSFCIYIYTIPLYMYAIRADLANIFSPLIKHLLLSMLIIYIMERIIIKKH